MALKALFSYLMFSTLLTALTAAEPAGKYKVCTITINSDDEKKVFKKHLNPNDFEFIELTPGSSKKEPNASQEEDNDWLSASCQSGIECDILLISGEFAGGFFGTSEHSLDLNELESKSCEKSCRGILNHPKEVFLMGCNTLATKESDQIRTPEEYMRVLLSHGFSNVSAERIVDARFGVLSSSNQATMRRIFQGVPNLYGFTSVGPSGKSIRSHLENYFKKKPDYRRHIEALKFTDIEKNISFLNKKQLKPRNTELLSALKISAITQCSGLGPEESSDRHAICAFNNPNIPREEKLALTARLAESPEFLNYFNQISDFFRKIRSRTKSIPYSESEKKILLQISKNEEAQKKILSLVRTNGTSGTKIQAISLSQDLNWISTDEAVKLQKEIIKSAFENIADPASRDYVRYLTKQAPSLTLEESDLPSNWESSLQIVSSVGKFRNLDESICLKLLENINKKEPPAKSNFTPTLNRKSLTALAKVNSLTPRTVESIAKSLGDPVQDPSQITQYFRVLFSSPTLKNSQILIHPQIQNAVKRELTATDPFLQSYAVRGAMMLEIKDPETAKTLEGIANKDTTDALIRGKILKYLEQLRPGNSPQPQ